VSAAADHKTATRAVAALSRLARKLEARHKAYCQTPSGQVRLTADRLLMQAIGCAFTVCLSGRLLVGIRRGGCTQADAEAQALATAQVLPSAVRAALAAQAPGSAAELAATQGLSQCTLRLYGAEILACLNSVRGHACPTPDFSLWLSCIC
jgi:hypothetical protein